MSRGQLSGAERSHTPCTSPGKDLDYPDDGSHRASAGLSGIFSVSRGMILGNCGGAAVAAGAEETPAGVPLHPGHSPCWLM